MAIDDLLRAGRIRRETVSTALFAWFLLLRDALSLFVNRRRCDFTGFTPDPPLGPTRRVEEILAVDKGEGPLDCGLMGHGVL